MKLVCAFSLLFVGLVCGQGTNCPTKLRAMDQAVEKALLLTNPELRPFKDPQDLQENYCDDFMEWTRTIGAYRSCLKSFQRTIFGIILSNMKKNYKRFCQSDAEAAKIVDHSKCFTADNKNVLQMTTHSLTGMVEYVADRPNPNDMIPGLCCGFLQLTEHVETQVDKICDSMNPGRKTGHFIRFIIENNIADAMDIMCGTYDSLQVCKTKVPQVTQELKTVIESANTVYNHTAFVSLLRFIERMDSTVNVQ